MPHWLSFLRARRTLLAGAAGLACVYAAVALHAAATVNVPTTPFVPVSDMPSGDVPQAVVDTLVNSTSRAGGDTLDLSELLVLPGDLPGTYVVSATIDVTGVAGADQKSVVTRQISQFMRGVYGSGIPILDAQVYVMDGGRLIAGAGLGRDAYREAAVTASAADESGWMERGVVSTSPGAADQWFEYDSAGIGD